MDIFNVITKPKDCTKCSLDEIVKYLNFEYLHAIDPDADSISYKKLFYCGITGNIDENLSRHNVKGYTACCLCESYQIAAQVEEKLGEMGFDIGNPKNKMGNGGNKDSKIVYMIKKEDNFKK